MRLLMSPCDGVVEQAIWTLGNIIGDNTQYRDMTLSLGIIPRLLAINIHEKSVMFRRTFVWVIVNLVRFKNSQISIQNSMFLLPIITELVTDNDNNVKVDAIWALTYLTDASDDYIQIVVESGIISSIVPMLSVQRFKVQVAAMRMLGNVATGTDRQTDVLISTDILLHIRFPLTHTRENLRRMALWCLSNITAGTEDQVQAVFTSGLLNRIAENLTRSDTRTCREALITISNMIHFGAKEQALEVINAGAVNSMFQLLLSFDDQIAITARDALSHLFATAGELVHNYSEIHMRLLRSPS